MIWILGDQLRAQALSINGDPNSRTPNWTRAEVNGPISRRTFRAFRCAVPSAVRCLPAGIRITAFRATNIPLPEGSKAIADVFNGNGYDTAYFGKWHLGGFHEWNGTRGLLHHRSGPPRRIQALVRL